MKKHLTTVAIFLLAGAVVNVAVAWGMAASVNLVISKRLGISKRQVSRTDDGSPVVLLEYCLVVTAGWPLNCGLYEWSFPVGGVGPIEGGLDLGLEPWPAPSPGGGFAWPKALPLRPMWPGFAINTLFYAAILWLVIPGPFALRRLIRRRRGLCAACGYDLRHAEHEACPECGVTA